MNDEFPYLTTQEAAGALGRDLSHVRRLCIEGKIKAVKRGRDWWIDRDSVRVYKESAHKPGPKPKPKKVSP